MRTIRGYFLDISAKTEKLDITGEYYNYFKNVLRLKKNNTIELFNSYDGKQYQAKIIEIDSRKINLKIISSKEIKNENKYTINLYQSIIKNENFETVIQKSTELGVNNIYPLITDNTNHKFNKKSFDKKLQRWNKIAISATEQCGRVFIPKIHNTIKVSEISLDSQKVNLVLCPYIDTNNHFIEKVQTNTHFNIFIGPEGGFTKTEMSYFKNKNFTMINLGKRILKAETAPINILSIINFLKQESNVY